ncbi:MAG: class I SAM-dependent methyltransferase [Bacteroidota bacterium]|nr:class I SAM-dependent methyltransferase [Bacteroidota bacterium]
MKKKFSSIYNGVVTRRFSYKVNKHLNLLKRRLANKSEVNKAKSFNNEALTAVIEAFEAVKNKNFSEKDLMAFARCEAFREKLLKDESLISYDVFGSDKEIPVKSICQTSTTPPVWAKFYYFLAKQFKSNKFLEIGTNLGVSGAYFLEALSQKENFKFVTMEGVQALCDIAKSQFVKITDESNLEVIPGLYDDTFPKVIEKHKDFDILFIDGNHQKDPTIEYFHALKNSITDPAILMFDDINYSLEMNEAWEIIKKDSDVNYSVDLHKLGIVIIDKVNRSETEDFSLFLGY